MLMKICPRCHEKHNYSDKCPNNCYEKNKKESNKVYDKLQRKNSDIYNSKEWKLLTKMCKEKFNSLCIWSFYEHKKIVKGSLSHHIIEINEDVEKAKDIDNLIWLCDEAHREIHNLYKIDRIGTQKRLIGMVMTYKKKFM